MLNRKYLISGFVFWFCLVLLTNVKLASGQGQASSFPGGIDTIANMVQILKNDPGNKYAIETCRKLLNFDQRQADSRIFEQIARLDRDSILTLYSNGIKITRKSLAGLELNWVPGGQVTRIVTDSSGMMPVKVPVSLEVTEGFWMSTCEITVGQYMRYLNDSRVFPVGFVPPSRAEVETVPLRLDEYNCYHLSGDYFADNLNKPMVMVSYKDARDFCRWLSRLDGVEYSLPGEIQWEIASRGELDEPEAVVSCLWCFGDEPSRLADYCWYDNLFMLSPAEVGKKQANIFGLYDMYGNVWEWCLDWHSERPWPPQELIKNPTGPEVGVLRVIKGGCWQSPADKCTSPSRDSANPELKDKAIGFRVVINPGSSAK